MTDAGEKTAPNEEGDSAKKPAWRRSGASNPAAPFSERPSEPVQPAPEPDDPEDPAADGSDRVGDGTAIQPIADVPAAKMPTGLDASSEADRTLITPPSGASGVSGSSGAGVGDSAIAGGATMMVPGGASTEFPTIPGVTITRTIGRGGMGVVYEGTQGYLDRRVAVKLLAEESCQSVEFTQRFRREAKILASLSHSNIVSCYQAGVNPDGLCFLAMEFIDGPTLEGHIEKRGAVTPEQTVKVGRAIAGALAFAHRSGIIHRDVKAPNVLLKTILHDPEDPDFPFDPMLADLGLARASGGLPVASDLTVQGLTVQGTVMGSPPTMAPEQFDSPDDVDFRTDIYGLGCVLFHCLTGKLAFPQGTLTSLIARKTVGAPPDPRELSRGVPDELAELVRSMIASAPADRPTSYEDLLSRLEGPFEVAPPRFSRVQLGVGAAALVLVGWFAVSALTGGSAGDDDDTAARNEASVAAATPAISGTDLTDLSGDGVVEPPALDPAALDDVDPIDETLDASGNGELGEPTSGAESDDAMSSGVEEETGDASAVVPVEEPDPVLVLPSLPSLDGQSLDLVSWTDWEALVGDLNSWLKVEEDDGCLGRDYDPERFAAKRELWDPPWTLTGKLKFATTRSPTENFMLVLEFDDGNAIALRQHSDGPQGDTTAHISAFMARVRDDKSGWEVVGQDLPELRHASVSGADYKSLEGMEFKIAWDAERLSIAWGFIEGDADAEAWPSLSFTAAELLPLGAPKALGVELENGGARLCDLRVDAR